MKRMKEILALDRPREKIAHKGVAVLSDQELIEAIVGKGTKKKDVREIAKEILVMIKLNPRHPNYEDLQEIEGVGPTRASQIMACIELGRRYFKPTDQSQKVMKPEDILSLVTEIKEKRQEHFVCITLNGAGEMIDKRVITVGLLNHSLVHPREVFADAITDRAASIICVHNHPSGSIEPSSQDILITNQLKDAGTLLGIQLLDHIIVTKNGYCSMKEKGLI